MTEMTELRIDMMAGHAILSAATGVSVRSIAGALHRLQCALAPMQGAESGGAGDRHRAASLQIVRYIADCVLCADLQALDDIGLCEDDPDPVFDMSIALLRVDTALSSGSARFPIDSAIAVDETVFEKGADRDAHCWSDDQWRNPGIETVALIRGFVGGQVYIIRFGRDTAEPTGPSTADWMAHFRTLVQSHLPGDCDSQSFSSQGPV